MLGRNFDDLFSNKKITLKNKIIHAIAICVILLKSMKKTYRAKHSGILVNIYIYILAKYMMDVWCI